MDSAVNQAIDQANQNNNTMMWVFLCFFVFAPLLLFFAFSIVAIIQQHGLKCPKCGTWRRNKLSGTRIVKTVDGGKTTVTNQRVVVCRKCKHEFVV